MSITIGAYTYDNLTAQPIAYEGDAKDGLTSRRFDAKVFIEDADFASLIGQYDTWRDARINDPDTLLSQTLGTTINVSGTWDGVTVTNLPCWYFTPPQQINKLGGYYAVEV